MFLRIVNVYLIFKHSHQKPKLFGIKIRFRGNNCGSENSYLYGSFLLGFNNYCKIAVWDHIHVPKF